jgi:hypothetical protein
MEGACLAMGLSHLDGDILFSMEGVCLAGRCSHIGGVMFFCKYEVFFIVRRPRFWGFTLLDKAGACIVF